MLIGAPQEMKRSEACFSAMSLNSLSRYMVAPRKLQWESAGSDRARRGSYDNVMK
jgi:hypothetical protein